MVTEGSDQGVPQAAANEVLRSLPKATVERFRGALRRCDLAAGTVLYEVGDRVDSIYFPVSGLLCFVMPMRDGHEVETTSRGRDGAVGYVEVTGSGIMLSRVVVRIRGAAWRLPASDYQAAFDASPALRDHMQRRTEVLLADARQASACRVLHCATDRLGRTLMEAHQHTGERVFRLTQELLADMLGVGRTTVTHAALQLQSRGLIGYRRGVVTLVDLPGLEAHACECYQALREVRAKILGGQADVNGL